MRRVGRRLSRGDNEEKREDAMACSLAPPQRATPWRCSPRRNSKASAGFSLPEVLVSSALLAMLAASSAQLFMNSGTTLQRSGLRDAVNARIAEDLEALRRETWRWACEDGSEGGSATACTGLSRDADKPVAYKTGRSVFTSLSELARYKTACGLTASGSRIPQTTAALMQQEHTLADGSKAFPSGSTNLSWGSSLPSHTSAVVIQRQITVNPSDGNQLDVSYATTTASPVQIKLHASLTPQALNWCP